MQTYEDKNMTIKIMHEGSAQPFLVIRGDKFTVNKSIIKVFKKSDDDFDEIAYITHFYDFLVEYEK